MVESAEYTRVSPGFGGDVDGFALTIAFGATTGVIPEQSLAGTIANLGYSGSGAFVDTAV